MKYRIEVQIHGRKVEEHKATGWKQLRRILDDYDVTYPVAASLGNFVEQGHDGYCNVILTVYRVS